MEMSEQTPMLPSLQTTAKRPTKREKYHQKTQIKIKMQKSILGFGCALARYWTTFQNHDVKHDYLYRFVLTTDLGTYMSDFCECSSNIRTCAWIEWCVVFMNWWIQNETLYKSMWLCIQTLNDSAALRRHREEKERASKGEPKINEKSQKLVIDAYKMLMLRHSSNRLLSFYIRTIHITNIEHRGIEVHVLKTMARFFCCVQQVDWK